MTEQMFKVGDKVTHREFTETGEVKFGPYQKAGTYLTGYYLVDFGDGTCRELRGACLFSPAPTFAVGDVVTLSTSGSRATVEYGPYGVNDDIYVVKLVDPPADPQNPRTFTALSSVMKAETARVPVGTRVRVDRAAFAEGSHGRMGLVTSNTETFRMGHGDTHAYAVELDGDGRIYAAEVTPVDDDPADGFEYKGVTYEYGVTYTDSDGDNWKFERPACEGDMPTSAYGSYSFGSRLDDVVVAYGPLEK